MNTIDTISIINYYNYDELMQFSVYYAIIAKIVLCCWQWPVT